MKRYAEVEVQAWVSIGVIIDDEDGDITDEAKEEAESACCTGLDWEIDKMTVTEVSGRDKLSSCAEIVEW